MKTHKSLLKMGLFILLIIALSTSLLPNPGVAQTGLDFDGSNDYVTFGVASDMGVQNFTIETWFKREGAGATTSTGSGGITAVPLVTKGRGEADGNNRDMNYFLGIRSSDNVLAADFEDMASGGNHPITGVTSITTGIWYHAAVTYDGSKWRLYLNGIFEAELTINQTPRWDSIQHAGLATAMQSGGVSTASGYFNGVLDEVRIWNYARTQTEIQDNMRLEIISGIGLVGRWGLNEGSGTTAGNSVSGGSDGTLTNGPSWVNGSPFEIHDALDFGSGNAYVTFGDPSELDLAQFTLETWFKREGTGSTANTGGGGVLAIPLVTKGVGEAENSTVDLNYFLGIRGSDNVLAADFEEGAGGTSPSLNHPIAGVTTISNDTWYHAAVTYDGNKWQLFLNGNLENELVVDDPVASTGTQHAGLGVALNSSGSASGHFDGVLDEVRIWNYARTQSEIQSTINSEITSSQAGLVAHWGLDEGAGTTVYGSAGTSVDGTITGSGYSWVESAPFNITSTPPAAPSGLTATASAWNQIDLSWTDDSDNESNFEIERSTSGTGGPFSLLATVGVDVTTYNDQNLNGATEYCYRVRATNSAGNSGYSNVDCATTPAEPNNALDFGGTNGYMTFGEPSELHLATFTIETWFRRDGTGVTTSTGTGGITSAIPMVTKGRGEADGNNKDMNYFLGIDNSTGVLAADFEEGAGGSNPGLNHPVYGTTTITTGAWYHAAVTYDGTKWQLFLNGNLETELTVGQPPRSDSQQHAGLATAMTSTGAAAGYFNGVLDEVRIWNYARTQTEIQSTVNSEITASQAGLVARWGLNEGSGTTIYGSAGTTVNGDIMGSNWSWTSGSPFNAPTDPPDADPSDLTATATVGGEIILEWADNSTNESNFEIEKSTTGSGGPFSLINTVGADVTTYTDNGLATSTEYWYRVRATNGYGNSNYSNVVSATTPATFNYAIYFGGTDAFVNFGIANELNTAQFTIETWFKKTGPGATGTTGTGGIANAIPLIAKGTSESEATAVDINYFLGIDTDNGNVIAADFEEGAGGANPSQNHPVRGTTSIVEDTWYHAAATYDGTTWRLYLNGNLEATLAIGQPPALPTNSLTTLATALETNGTTHDGYFEGIMDEVHIWNYARTEVEIQSTINSEITTPQTGLIGCWNLNENTGTTVNGSAGTTTTGTITGSNWSWSSGAPFNITINHAPNTPVLVSPSDGATNVAASPNLTVNVSDTDGDNLTVTFYGRVASTTAQPDFTIVGIPDTQYYTSSKNGGSPAIFNAQTQWIMDNRTALNIVFASHLGDVTENGDLNTTEWDNANTAMSILESPAPGLPYGIAIGNHDQYNGGTTNYNNYFGVSRFTGRSYYGGHYGTDNNNHYIFFSASGMDFIAIHLEYDTSPDQAVLDWADNLLKTYSTRRGIVVCHYIIGTGNPGSFSTQGQAIYDNLKDNPNLFLMLCGHVTGEGQRADTYSGNTIYTLLSDYQGRSNGGDGWLRYMTFKPSENKIYVYTYSPTRNGGAGEYETDGDSQFTLDYNMSEFFSIIGTNTNVPSGSNTSVTWSGLSYDTEYEWYVTVSDGNTTTAGSTWSFTTQSAPPPGVLVEAKVFLEGPYNTVAHQMTTDINSLIPTTSPYPEDDRTVDSIPANVTDWVLVQLRSTLDGSAVASKSAFLHRDGRIVADNGTTGQITINAPDDDYHIVIKHRNHLAVMSASAITLSSSSSSLYNFTTAQSQAYGTNPMRSLETDVFGMRAGDGNSDGGVDALDKNLIWRPQNGTTWEYTRYGDFNLDGGIDALDLNLKWRPNNGTGTQVPEPI